jgi:hypothetical protein
LKRRRPDAAKIFQSLVAVDERMCLIVKKAAPLYPGLHGVRASAEIKHCAPAAVANISNVQEPMTIVGRCRHYCRNISGALSVLWRNAALGM